MVIVDKIIDLMNSGRVFTDIKIAPEKTLSIMTPLGWEDADSQIISKSDVNDFSVSLIGVESIEQLIEILTSEGANGSIDIAKTLSGIVRLRCNFSLCGNGTDSQIEVSIRKLPVIAPSISDIGIPEGMVPVIVKSKGLWLITGPTGNGKSTTIAAILEYVNQKEAKHILTIEHPIEFVMSPKRSIITQREVGQQLPSFAAGLHAALRQRPDIILIGEVRDKETLDTMVNAAESGHLVFSTLHSKNVEDALTKISGYYGENNKQKLMSLAMNLGGIISQTLVPSIDKKSLVLVYEIYVNNPEGQQIIRAGEFQKIRNAIASGKANGSCLMNDVLDYLVKAKKISTETARNTAYDKSKFF